MLIKVRITYPIRFYFLIPFLVAVTSFGLLSCSDKLQTNQQQAAQQVPVPPPPAAPKVTEEKEKPVYVYTGDRFRDPFTEVGAASGYQESATFNPQQAKVKAIIYGSQLQSAVINISGGGSYYVKGKRIFDVMGKTVKGFEAKVFMEKVVITSDTNEIFELKIKEDEEGEKS